MQDDFYTYNSKNFGSTIQSACSSLSCYEPTVKRKTVNKTASENSEEPPERLGKSILNRYCEIVFLKDATQ